MAISKDAFECSSFIVENWDYYISLEDKIESIEKYISFDSSNSQVYSLEILHLFLAVCCEVDVVAKRITKQISGKVAKTLPDAIEEIKKKYLTIENDSITINTSYFTSSRWSFTPWMTDPTSNKKTPKWWNAYNDVKHHRSEISSKTKDSFFKEASLENLLNAIAGLYVLEIWYIKEIGTENEIATMNHNSLFGTNSFIIKCMLDLEGLK